MKWHKKDEHLPEPGRVVQVRVTGEAGYASDCVYNRSAKKFQSKVRRHDRVVITQWNCDEWRYQKSYAEPRRKKYNSQLGFGGR